jgi:hypothetical protein
MLYFTKQACRPSAEPADKLIGWLMKFVGWLMKIFVLRIGLMTSSLEEMYVDGVQLTNEFESPIEVFKSLFEQKNLYQEPISKFL